MSTTAMRPLISAAALSGDDLLPVTEMTSGRESSIRLKTIKDFSNTDITTSGRSGQGMMVDYDSPTFGWRDIIGAVQPKTSGAGTPLRTSYRGNLFDYSFALNDAVDFVFHIPHDWVPGTQMYFHVHWSHTGTAVSGTAEFTIYVAQAKGHNLANFGAERTLVISYPTVDIATTPQYRHRIDELIMTSAGGSASTLDIANTEVDGLVLATLKLTSLPSITSGKLFIHTCDIHYQSTNLSTKGKAPSFYVP